MKRWGLFAALILVATQVSGAWSLNLADRKLPYIAPAAAFHSQGNKQTLAAYRGRKVMLWLFSTWCHTCAVGVKAMAGKRSYWQQQDLVILAVRNHQNGGYPGPSITAFVQRFGGTVARAPNWVLGEASAEMDRLYNARKFPDIYFLIDEKGMVQTVSTAPAVTMDKITMFAEGR